MSLNYKDACNILNIDPNIENISPEVIKKQYRYNALKYHPDKNCSEKANEEFIRISNAYEYLINNNENTERNKSYIDIFSDFLEQSNMFNNQHSTNLFITIFKNIILECEDKTFYFLKDISNQNLLVIIKIIKNNRDLFIFNDGFINKIEELYINKLNNEIHVILNPLIDDLLEDNIYKYYFENSIYIIPLWHKEVIINSEDKEVYIYCKPMLPNNIIIDDDNNIFIEIRENIKNIFNKEKYYFNIGKQIYHINNNQIQLLTYQEIILKKQGISKINFIDILNNKNRGNIIVKLSLIF
jgi:curved DNA-binding protein CbpA